MKQTAVEWFIEQLNSKYGSDDFIITHINEINQAKEMEKEQIENAFHKNSQKFLCEEEAEQYYKETFKQQEQ
jgi:hypothetical protein